MNKTTHPTVNHKHSWVFKQNLRKCGGTEIYTIQRCSVCGKTRKLRNSYNPNSDKGKKIF